MYIIYKAKIGYIDLNIQYCFIASRLCKCTLYIRDKFQL